MVETQVNSGVYKPMGACDANLGIVLINPADLVFVDYFPPMPVAPHCHRAASMAVRIGGVPTCPGRWRGVVLRDIEDYFADFLRGVVVASERTNELVAIVEFKVFLADKFLGIGKMVSSCLLDR